MSEWFENDEFWTQMYPYMFPENKFEIAEEQVDKILEMTGIQEGNVLDLCCGPGRHSCEFAKRGFEVTGVDRTPFLQNKAKERAKDFGVEVEWVLEDMRNFIRKDAFDLVINMFTSFGYFDDKDEDIHVLKNIYNSLKNGGVCIIESMGKEVLAKFFTPTTSTEYEDGTLLIQRHEVFDGWSRMRNEWILLKDEKATSFKFHHTIYSGQELKDRLLLAGFSDVKICKNLEGDEYDNTAQRLVAVAKK